MWNCCHVFHIFWSVDFCHSKIAGPTLVPIFLQGLDMFPKMYIFFQEKKLVFFWNMNYFATFSPKNGTHNLDEIIFSNLLESW